ncbi:MAG: c-type cytochrome [Pseudomonadota bacterium]
MDTMTITKAGAAFCGSLLVLLLGAWAAEGLYHVGGGHGEDHAQGYVILDEASEDTEVAEEAEPEVPFEEVFVNASAADGERLWRACAACHKLEDGANGTGPHLYGVVGREKAAIGEYSYSEAMASQDGAWTPDNLNAFLLKPTDYTPGTKMSYRGMPDIEDRANLIAYLQTYGS